MNEQNFVKLPAVFSTPKLPVTKTNIPQQQDISKYPHLKGIQLPKIKAPKGLLIGNDVPKALEPKQVIASSEKGPYAVKIIFGWTLNGPLDGKENSRNIKLHQSR